MVLGGGLRSGADLVLGAGSRRTKDTPGFLLAKAGCLSYATSAEYGWLQDQWTFVKMKTTEVEYGIMQAYAEGFTK